MHIPPMIGIYFNGVFSKLVGCAYSTLKLHTCTYDINEYHQLKNLDSSWKCTNVSFQKLEILKHVCTPNKSLMTRTLYEDEKSSSHWFKVVILRLTHALTNPYFSARTWASLGFSISGLWLRAM